ncbi:hypothetical protein RIF29_28678 [Crotalaria pallida]|uniref:Uncharacterized protein n=1 Tax=Crotalaria pallida TaxID=3830 RepID=A0AAN9EFH5_CROPI
MLEEGKTQCTALAASLQSPLARSFFYLSSNPLHHSFFCNYMFSVFQSGIFLPLPPPWATILSFFPSSFLCHSTSNASPKPNHQHRLPPTYAHTTVQITHNLLAEHIIPTNPSKPREHRLCQSLLLKLRLEHNIANQCYQHHRITGGTIMSPPPKPSSSRSNTSSLAMVLWGSWVCGCVVDGFEFATLLAS